MTGIYIVDLSGDSSQIYKADRSDLDRQLADLILRPDHAGSTRRKWARGAQPRRHKRTDAEQRMCCAWSLLKIIFRRAVI